MFLSAFVHCKYKAIELIDIGCKGELLYSPADMQAYVVDEVREVQQDAPWAAQCRESCHWLSDYDSRAETVFQRQLI